VGRCNAEQPAASNAILDVAYQSAIDTANAQIRVKKRGDKFAGFHERPIATYLIYGLINVRTDGQYIMCAFIKEATEDFDIKVFRAGIDPT
jgi:hypothetical protein